ncbi:MAG: oligosaccharide biosynthesis protein Alg14-like protein [Chloroflexi bacterium]|nr:MAG: oligosaccharide biosynthesis protein Alg14-like protein [Chloroflexota bacterium]
MKICLVCSHGGHLTETLQIMEAFVGHDCFFVTYHSSRDNTVMSLTRAYFTQNIGMNVWRMAKAMLWAPTILRREKPDVILSLGAEIALPFMVWGWLLRIRTIFIESWCRTDDLSLTGRLVMPIVDRFWVQWPQLLTICSEKAECHGAVI